MMKKSIALFIALFIAVFCSSAAFAVQPFPAVNNFSVGLGAGGSYYQEPPGQVPQLTIDGKHYSLNLAYTNYHIDSFLLQLSQQFTMGPVDYQGYQGQGSISDASDTLFNTRLLSGYNIVQTKYVSVIPFLGVGYRNLHDDLHAGSINSVTQSHYPLRVINYLYSPVGVFLITQMGPQAAIQMHFEYDIFWHGEVITNAFQVQGVPLPKVVNEQAQGYGLRASIEFLIPDQRRLFSVGPFVHYWNIHDSNTVTSEGIQFVEPENSTMEVGAEASIIF